MRFMSWDRSPEAVMRLSMRALARHGIRRLQIAEPMNDTAAASAVARMAKDEGIEQVVAAVTFTESPVHTDDLYRCAAKTLADDACVDAVYLKDPGGLLTPERAAVLLPELRQAVGERTLELHSHCTSGLAPQVYVLAAQAGVDVLHTAIGALANGTSQPSVTRLAANLATLGIEVDVDLDAVAEAESILDSIARAQGLEPGQPTELDLTHRTHQLPGGMMGTLRAQLRELRMEDQLPAVLEEAVAVRAELGYPIMVTPYSQFVGSQAVLNVAARRSGQPRWSRVPDEIVRYVLGHFGAPPAPVAGVVRDAVAPRTGELDRPVEEPSLDALRAEVARRLGRAVDDDEALLHLVLPVEQVAAIAPGPAPTWTPATSRRTVREGPRVSTKEDFVRAVQGLPGWRSLDVTLGSESVSLRRGSR
jgi:oxaloacetate decarboxylase alpha subunit